MESLDMLDRTQLNSMISEAVVELDYALMYIANAKSEIGNTFSGLSFNAYQEVLNDLYNSINNTKYQLNNLYC